MIGHEKGIGMAQRVLHIFGQMERGGAESRTMDLFRKIDRQRVVFDFVVMKPGRHYFFDEIEQLGGRIFYINPPMEGGFIAHAKALTNIMRTQGPFYAVHAHTAFNEAIALTAAWICGIGRRVAHSRSAPMQQKTGWKYRLYSSIMRRILLFSATERLMCSHEAGVYLFGEMSVRKGLVQFFPNAIDVTTFGDTLWRLSVRTELGLADDAIVIGTVGNLREVKNHSFLLEAFAALHKRRRNTVLLLVGAGPLENVLKARVRHLGLEKSVFFLGARSDVPRLLAAMDVFVLPSLYEGLPGAAVEAQASALPCLLSDRVTREIAICRELVTFLPLESGPVEWAAALSRLADYPRRCVVDCQKELREAGYDAAQAAVNLLSIYGLDGRIA